MDVTAPGSIDTLLRWSVDRLTGMFLPASGLFCHHVDGGRPVGVSVRYSAIVSIGLARARRFLEVPFNVERLLETVDARVGDVELSAGDLGLMLWAHAETGQMNGVERVLERLRILTHNWSPRRLMQTTAMELAWMHMGLVRLGVLVRSLAHERRTVERVLLERFHSRRTGLFRQRGVGLRRRFANFASQIYPVLSLASSHLAFGSPVALDAAMRCTRRLIRLRGEDGAWPWLYDSQTGGVVEPLEFYSVHQYGMGPMALTALTRASGVDYGPALVRSMRWLCDNRHGLPTLDETRQAICRSVRRKRPVGFLKYVNAVGAALSSPRPAFGAGGAVELNRATRPYEYGWLLYAWAGRSDVLRRVETQAA